MIDWIKISIIFFALILPLLIDLRANKNILFTDLKNIGYYTLVWAIVAIVSILTQLYPERHEIILFFYVAMSFIVHHLTIYQLNAEKYKEESENYKKEIEGSKRLYQDSITKQEEYYKSEMGKSERLYLDTIKSQEEYMKRIPNILALSDDCYATVLCDYKTQEEVLQFFETKSEEYVIKGIFTETTRKDYDLTIKRFILREFERKKSKGTSMHLESERLLIV